MIVVLVRSLPAPPWLASIVTIADCVDCARVVATRAAAVIRVIASILQDLNCARIFNRRISK